MGDVLTGIVAGLMAQGLNAWQAACLAVCVHGEAGDTGAQKNGSRGMLASDLAPYVQELLN
jgi:NAD(P)H-hydrate epimerase